MWLQYTGHVLSLSIVVKLVSNQRRRWVDGDDNRNREMKRASEEFPIRSIVFLVSVIAGLCVLFRLRISGWWWWKCVCTSDRITSP